MKSSMSQHGPGASHTSPGSLQVDSPASSLHDHTPSPQQLAPFSQSGSASGSQHGAGGHSSPGSSQPRQLQPPSEQHSAPMQSGASAGSQHSPPPVVPTVPPSLLDSTLPPLLLLSLLLLSLLLLSLLLLDSGAPLLLSLPLSVEVGVPVSLLLLSLTVVVGVPDELSSVVKEVDGEVVVSVSPVEPDELPLSETVASPTSSAHAAMDHTNESARRRRFDRCMT
jgi:hypothetical protein